MGFEVLVCRRMCRLGLLAISQIYDRLGGGSARLEMTSFAGSRQDPPHEGEFWGGAVHAGAGGVHRKYCKEVGVKSKLPRSKRLQKFLFIYGNFFT